MKFYLHVRDHIPLEQGLRPLERPSYPRPRPCQRPYSIRTRIKTPVACIFNRVMLVRDHIPLEQGLRH